MSKIKSFVAFGFVAILLSACTLDHRWDMASSLEGNGYPVDYREASLRKANRPLNGLHYASATLHPAKLNQVAKPELKRAH